MVHHNGRSEDEVISFRNNRDYISPRRVHIRILALISRYFMNLIRNVTINRSGEKIIRTDRYQWHLYQVTWISSVIWLLVYGYLFQGNYLLKMMGYVLANPLPLPKGMLMAWFDKHLTVHSNCYTIRPVWRSLIGNLDIQNIFLEYPVMLRYQKCWLKIVFTQKNIFQGQI